MNESDARKAAFTRLNYPPGTRLVLDRMDDPYGVPSGTWGTIQMVDDRGHIHMIWDNGRSLSLVPGADTFHKVTEQDLESRAPAVREAIRDFMQFAESSPLPYAFAATFDKLSEEQVLATIKQCAGNTDTEAVYEAIKKVVGFNPQLSDREFIDRFLAGQQEITQLQKPESEDMEESQGGMQWQM